jgi:7-cyano-7-deazaguanine synthase in queuosine biosynthesis
MSKALLLNSGGKDSLATAILARRSGWELSSLYVELGQRNSSEARLSSKRIADKHCADHFELIVNSPHSLIIPIPGGIFGIAYQAVTIHSLAASVAVSRGIERVFSGQRYGANAAQFPRLFNELLQQSRYTPHIVVDFPVFSLSDEEIFKIVSPDPLWRDTVTCNVSPPCGVCGRCKLRASWLGR